MVLITEIELEQLVRESSVCFTFPLENSKLPIHLQILGFTNHILSFQRVDSFIFPLKGQSCPLPNMEMTVSAENDPIRQLARHLYGRRKWPSSSRLVLWGPRGTKDSNLLQVLSAFSCWTQRRCEEEKFWSCCPTWKALGLYTFGESTNGEKSRNIIYNMSSMVAVVVKTKYQSSTL